MINRRINAIKNALARQLLPAPNQQNDIKAVQNWLKKAASFIMRA